MTYEGWFHHLGADADYDPELVLTRERFRLAREATMVDDTADPAQADE